MALSGFSLGHLIGGLYGAETFEKITVGAAVKTLTEGKYTQRDTGRDKDVLAKRVFITVETSSLRYKYMGDDPSSTEGHIARPNSTITIVGTANIKNFKAIRTGSTSAVLMITYEF